MSDPTTTTVPAVPEWLDLDELVPEHLRSGLKDQTDRLDRIGAPGGELDQACEIIYSIIQSWEDVLPRDLPDGFLEWLDDLTGRNRVGDVVGRIVHMLQCAVHDDSPRVEVPAPGWVARPAQPDAA